MLIAAAFILGILALAFAGSLIARHWKELLLLDPSSIKEEREREQREVLIRRRFDRIRADQFSVLARLGRRVSAGVHGLYDRTYERLKAFESVYQNVASPLASIAPSSRERIKTLLLEARSLARDLKWADAERRLLEVLSIDPRNADAYKALGQMYIRQRLFPQAKETFEFVVKLRKADDATWAGLAEVALAEGAVTTAAQYRVKAVEASPRNPFRQAELATFYLEQGEPEKALAPAKRASDLEPGSVKYLELSLDAAIAAQDAKEARRRFDALRLKSDDHASVQGYREKLDALEADRKVPKKG